MSAASCSEPSPGGVSRNTKTWVPFDWRSMASMMACKAVVNVRLASGAPNARSAALVSSSLRITASLG